jgi:SAM-dependent methyltransferase
MDIRNLFDNPTVFALSQRLIPFTPMVCEDLIRRQIVAPAGAKVLDIGCGVGSHRRFFPGAEYVGIDINSDYVTRATRLHGGDFRTMDATRLEFRDASFDLTLCVAAFHHLSDEQASAAIRESFRVVKPGGMVHIIDAVLPADPEAWFKRWFFNNDRGRFQRTEDQMRDLAEPVRLQRLPHAQSIRGTGATFGALRCVGACACRRAPRATVYGFSQRMPPMPRAQSSGAESPSTFANRSVE